MGCSSSNTSGMKRGVVDITSFDMSKPVQRQVRDFPFYGTRLQEIDYETIIREGQEWTDPNFQPISSSIVDDDISPNRQSCIRNGKDLEWRRPKDVYGEGNFCIYKNIGPSDIIQGALGDCYFTSALSSLAEYPERIQRIFITQQPNTAGCYAVSMYINGEKRTVVVDDKFPFDTSTNKYAFCRSSKDGDNEIWSLIIEKAWAKVFGSYQRVEAGTTGEAFYPLSGKPQSYYLHSNVKKTEKLWDTIRAADQRSYPMCTAVSSMAEQSASHQELKAAGFADDHAYSLIAVKLITLENGKQERLIKIRNPWGQKEWKGDWSDKSPKWTESTKRQVNLESKNDGCFWICFNDYMSFFYITTICYFNEDTQDNYIADQHDLQGFGMCKFTLDTDHTESMVFAVDQINSRFVDKTMMGDYCYPAIKLMLTKVRTALDPATQTQTIRQHFIHGTREADTHASMPIDKGLKRGTYLLMYQAEFTEDYHERKLVVSVYCNSKVQLDRVEVKDYAQENYTELDWALYGACMGEEDVRDDDEY